MNFKFKIKIKTWQKSVLKIFDFLVARAFIFFLVLFVIDLGLGALVFYRYTFPSQDMVVETETKPLQLDKPLLEEILREIEKNEERFLETESKTYPNLFGAREEIKREEIEEGEVIEELTE